MPISLTSKVAAKSSVFSAKVHGELVLFHPENGKYFGSGPVGESIWSLIEEGNTGEQVVESIVAEFDIDRVTAERDVIDFLTQLSDQGCLDVLEI